MQNREKYGVDQEKLNQFIGQMLSDLGGAADDHPTPDANRVLADYLNGIAVTGGTGAFAGATGQTGAFGAVDLKLGELTLRYAGTVCFKPPSQ